MLTTKLSVRISCWSHVKLFFFVHRTECLFLSPLFLFYFLVLVLKITQCKKKAVEGSTLTRDWCCWSAYYMYNTSHWSLAKNLQQQLVGVNSSDSTVFFFTMWVSCYCTHVHLDFMMNVFCCMRDASMIGYICNSTAPGKGWQPRHISQL